MAMPSTPSGSPVDSSDLDSGDLNSGDRNRGNTLSDAVSPSRILAASPPAPKLDICVRYTLWDDLNSTPKWMIISIPCIIPVLKDLILAQAANIGLCNTKLHNHDFDKPPRRLPLNFKIVKDSFPFVHCDPQSSFDSPGLFFKDDISSTCMGSILYCVGGDSEDIVDGLQEIYGNFPPPPQPQPLKCIRVEDYSLWENSKIEKIYVSSTKIVSGVSDTTTGNVKAKVGGGGICHKIWFRDLSNPCSQWREGSPLLSPRLFPHLVSYQGKLYAFGGNRASDPFAEVYDPKSEIWTLLEQPPFGSLSFAEMLVVPLKGLDRLWLFSLNRNIDYTYHVLTGKWEIFECANDCISQFKRQSSFASVFTPKKNVVIYWVNYKGQVYAYNLSTKVLYMGTVNGLRKGKRNFQEGMHVSLSHLYRDIFCLIGREVRFSGSYKAIIHVSLLQISLTAPPNFRKPEQVSRNCPPEPLSASVLACFAFPSVESIDVNDAYIMSPDINAKQMRAGRMKA